MDRQERAPLGAYRVFYPAAALYGALVLPASVLAMTGYAGTVPGLALASGHAHEMLLGFALAVVAGNQLGAVRARQVVALLALWVAARAAFVLVPASALAGVLNAAFVAWLAIRVLPRLFRSAKKLRNQALPATLAALCAAAAAWELEREADAWRALPQVTVALFALLLLFMGGRVLVPTIAGQLQAQGGRLDVRVQPRLEAALILACGVAAVALAVPGGRGVAAAALAAAGVLAAVRLARWRLWAVRGRADILCLAAGYGWLALGLAGFGASLAAGCCESAALHLITVGGLGTLTFNVMALSWLLKSRRSPAGQSAIVWGTALLAAATVLRGVGAPDSPVLLLAAAACWAAAFAVLVALFWRSRRRP